MIPCICIDDSNKPADFPESKWVKKNTMYHIIDAVILLPSMSTGFKLHELPLDDSCYPYLYFDYSRFIIAEESLQDYRDLIEALTCPMDFKKEFNL